LAPDAQQGDVRFQSKRFAYVDGEFSVDPNSLPLRYQVIKGYEHLIAEGELSSGLIREGAITVPLSRWSPLADQSWYSGDNHIHNVSPKACRLEMEAEDLDVANILTSDFTVNQAEFEGRLNRFSSRRRLIYVNQEFRNNHLGHLCLLNLKRPIEPLETMQAYEYPLHLRACDETHAQGGYVSLGAFPELARRRKSSGCRYGEVGRAGNSLRTRSPRVSRFHEKYRAGIRGQSSFASLVPLPELWVPASRDGWYR
jgi:hypothetical protein